MTIDPAREAPPPAPTSRSDCLGLTLVVLAIWIVAVPLAYLASGTLGIEGVSYSAILCLLPGWLVFAATDLYGIAASVVARVGLGMGLRMLFVLGGAIAVRAFRPEIPLLAFVPWLLLFYLVTLALETRWLTRDIAASTPPKGDAAPPVETTTEP